MISDPAMLSASRIVIIGFGSVGQTLIPLLIEHFDLTAAQLQIIAADEEGRCLATTYSIEYTNFRLTPQNYADALSRRLNAGDWLINLAVGVSSLALVKWCRNHAIKYLDTSVEPWAEHHDQGDDAAPISNYLLRHEILKLHIAGSPTAVIAHGANPGLISHFVKTGLINLAKLKQIREWSCMADLAQQLQIKVVQVAELDKQGMQVAFKPEIFFNTWSVEGLIAEAQRFGELGWGSHEECLPQRGQRHRFGDETSISIAVPGAEIMVKTWLPGEGEQEAYLIAHHEALSIANFLTIPGVCQRYPIYRPTVFYAYRPSPLTQQSLKYWVATNYRQPQWQNIMRVVLEYGVDRVGALFVFPGGCYWYGSTLSLEQARQFVPHGNATTLQVAAGILGALAWMCENPNAGVVEAESIDTDAVMRVAQPYLGDVSGALGSWQPCKHGKLQFDEFLLSGHQALYSPPYDLLSHARILDHV